jgi:hypothetical protein
VSAPSANKGIEKHAVRLQSHSNIEHFTARQIACEQNERFQQQLNNEPNRIEHEFFCKIDVLTDDFVLFGRQMVGNHSANVSAQ